MPWLARIAARDATSWLASQNVLPSAFVNAARGSHRASTKADQAAATAAARGAPDRRNATRPSLAVPTAQPSNALKGSSTRNTLIEATTTTSKPDAVSACAAATELVGSTHTSL